MGTGCRVCEGLVAHRGSGPSSMKWTVIASSISMVYCAERARAIQERESGETEWRERERQTEREREKEGRRILQGLEGGKQTCLVLSDMLK